MDAIVRRLQRTKFMLQPAYKGARPLNTCPRVASLKLSVILDSGHIYLWAASVSILVVYLGGIDRVYIGWLLK